MWIAVDCSEGVDMDPEEETLLEKSDLPALSTETSAILNSLQPTSWRCSICKVDDGF